MKNIFILMGVLIITASFTPKSNVTEVSGYPKPEGVDNLLFYVQRTINANTIVYTLNEDKDGNLNEIVGVEKIRQYVYYTETKTPLNPTNHKDNKHFLGKHNETAYYFNYEQDEVTTLDHAFLATMKTKAEQYVIYADNCLLTKDFMTKHHIIFKKIPRDITRF